MPLDANNWLAVQAGATGMQAVGAIIGALGQRSALKTQAEIADINATTMERQAQGAMLAGQRDEQRQLLATAGLKATQRNAMAANGIDLGEGSAAQVLTSTDVMGAIDRNTIAANAVRSAWGYRTQASNFATEATVKRAQAGAVNPLMAGATSLIGSATSVSGEWYRLNQAGAFNQPAAAPRQYGRGDR